MDVWQIIDRVAGEENHWNSSSSSRHSATERVASDVAIVQDSGRWRQGEMRVSGMRRHRGRTPGEGVVLLADDDRECLQVLEWAFEIRGLATLSVTNGYQAWNTLRTRSDIRIAVLNWMLPGLDGHWICRRLAEDASPVTTVLMLGGYFLPAVCARPGSPADHLLAKPFSQVGIDEQLSKSILAAFGSL